MRKSKGYWEGITPLGSLFIRMDKDERVIGMYTIFTTESLDPNEEDTSNTTKFMPDPRWDGDPEIAKLFLEERYNIKKKADEVSKNNTINLKRS